MNNKYPPKLSLDEAIKIIKIMYSEFSDREIVAEKIISILKTSRGSSFFADKISALQKFGFVVKRPHDILYLTDLAMQIIELSGSEQNDAILTAFKRINVLSDLLQRYPAGKLPSSEVLENLLFKTHQIDKSTLKKWEEFVKDSFAAISDIVGSSSSLIAHTESIKSTKESISLIPESAMGYHFTIPLDSGELIRLIIPKSASSKDLTTARSFIDALLRREQ